MAVHHQAEDGGGGVGGEAGVVAQDPRNNHLSLDTVLDTCLSCSLSSTLCRAQPLPRQTLSPHRNIYVTNSFNNLN